MEFYMCLSISKRCSCRLAHVTGFIVALMSTDPTTNPFFLEGTMIHLFTSLLSIEMSQNYGLCLSPQVGISQLITMG